MQDIDTPALIIDLDILEKNIAIVHNFMKARKGECNMRPHVKCHKSPAIASLQLDAGGAKGICVAKLGEAEVFASVGFKDIFITNEIVTRQKIERLARLSTWCDVKVAVDNPANIEELSKIAQENGTEIGVCVDINMGQFDQPRTGALDRCGVLPGKDALALAKKVVNSKGLKFRGLMGYEGSMSSFPKFQDRKEAVHRALEPLIETRDMIREAGIAVEMVSAGSTGSWNITGDYPGVTEVQAGSYALMDMFHNLEGIQTQPGGLRLLTTIISTPYPGKAIADAGMKTITSGSPYGGGMPTVKDIQGIEVTRLNVEHAHLMLKNPTKQVNIGDKIELIPYMGDPTVNHHDKYYVTRNGRVIAEWPILARGRAQ